jgi:hypothetical protein
MTILRACLALAVVAFAAACSDPAPKTDTTAVSSQTVTPSGAAACATDADCVGKPAKPQVQMCVKGSKSMVQCRAGVCASACAQVACTADAECPTGSACKSGGCVAAP